VRPGFRVRRLPPELGEDRVHLHDENGRLFSLPAGWTDVVPLDPFVVIAAGRCPFTADGLLAMACWRWPIWQAGSARSETAAGL
jgi:hypothetical protein